MSLLPFSDGTGALIRHADFGSRYISPRHVDVWYPPAYLTSPTVRYPVIYMHDGQNLFDPATSYGGVDWGMDEALLHFCRETGHPGAIIVGIWNSPLRLREYMPARPLTLPEGQPLLPAFLEKSGGEPLSDAYLRFITTELKPFIDATYRTLPDQPHTFLMGSSMGGLISLYGLTEYPDVFGGAGCLSTHWPIGQEPLVRYFGAALPRAGRHKLYFDFGTTTLDADYEPYQRLMDELVQAASYTAGHDWLTQKFEGAEHSERAWRVRVQIPLAFLLT